MSELQSREEITALSARMRSEGARVVFTNGCFDILHAGHVELLHTARAQGDFLIVGINSDDSVRRLKGPTRPINNENARAAVLAALRDVDAVTLFPEDTPEALIAAVRPNVHVKGGDYRPEDLPEAQVVREGGGEIVIVPLVPNFSTTGTLEKLAATEDAPAPEHAPAVIVIPARYASTRFPGKPLADLDGRPVIAHVIEAALRSKADWPIVVATDNETIAATVRSQFPNGGEVEVAMTSAACATGTDRIAEAVTACFGSDVAMRRLIVVNVQGDEPFINPAHIDALIELMRNDPELEMATLATPLPAAMADDPNVVKVVLASNGDALYFSRLPVPCQRDPGEPVRRLRHLGVYAYSAAWLLKMAKLPGTLLENTEKLEQLRALENGTAIRVAVVESTVDIAIDTPEDLERARAHLHH